MENLLKSISDQNFSIGQEECRKALTEIFAKSQKAVLFTGRSSADKSGAAEFVMTAAMECGVELFRNGRPTDLDFDTLLEEPLSKVDLPLDIVMGDGPGESRLLASDLSHAYVTLNSDYRS